MTPDYRKSKSGRRRFRFKRFYRLTFHVQNLLQLVGINWHNRFSDECTHDFSCCTGTKPRGSVAGGTKPSGSPGSTLTEITVVVATIFIALTLLVGMFRVQFHVWRTLHPTAPTWMFIFK